MEESHKQNKGFHSSSSVPYLPLHPHYCPSKEAGGSRNKAVGLNHREESTSQLIAALSPFKDTSKEERHLLSGLPPAMLQATAGTDRARSNRQRKPGRLLSGRDLPAAAQKQGFGVTWEPALSGPVTRSPAGMR